VAKRQARPCRRRRRPGHTRRAQGSRDPAKGLERSVAEGNAGHRHLAVLPRHPKRNRRQTHRPANPGQGTGKIATLPARFFEQLAWAACCPSDWLLVSERCEKQAEPIGLGLFDFVFSNDVELSQIHIRSRNRDEFGVRSKFNFA